MGCGRPFSANGEQIKIIRITGNWSARVHKRSDVPYRRVRVSAGGFIVSVDRCGQLRLFKLDGFWHLRKRRSPSTGNSEAGSLKKPQSIFDSKKILDNPPPPARQSTTQPSQAHPWVWVTGAPCTRRKNSGQLSLMRRFPWGLGMYPNCRRHSRLRRRNPFPQWDRERSESRTPVKAATRDPCRRLLLRCHVSPLRK